MKGVLALLVFGLGLLGSSAVVIAADDPPATEPENTTTVATLADPTPTRTAPPAKDAAAADSSGSVAMTDSLKFSPSSISISVGDTVTWNNPSNTAHNVTASGFSSGTVNPGSSYSHTFNSAGTFSYSCTFHSGMNGTVRVAGASSSGGGNTSGAGSESSAGASPDAAGSGSQLPATGSSALPLALMGFMMLGSGLALRRRTAQ